MPPNPPPQPTGCCPIFNPKPWDSKEIVFTDKLFIKDRVKSIFHIPLNFGKVMVRNITKMEKVGADISDCIVLSDENSPFGSDVYISTDKEIPDAQMVNITGTYLSKVFEGPYKNMGKWIKEMNEYMESQGKTSKKFLFYYTTCPKCAKVYGKNYVVILAKI